jgi:hypothetical protein
MAKRLILKHTLQHGITYILETLRNARINAPAGGMVNREAMILVDDADVARAIQLLGTMGIEAGAG